MAALEKTGVHYIPSIWHPLKQIRTYRYPTQTQMTFEAKLQRNAEWTKVAIEMLPLSSTPTRIWPGHARARHALGWVVLLGMHWAAGHALGWSASCWADGLAGKNSRTEMSQKWKHPATNNALAILHNGFTCVENF